MRSITCVTLACIVFCGSALAQVKTLKPGWNLFSKQQDIQLGKEASTEVDQKMVVAHNRELDDYLNTILVRLAHTPYSDDYPYTIHAISDKNINAFSLPGGPVYVNTGLILAADNEAQLAGVIAHEMSHIVLRHATNRVTKRNFIALPAALAGALAGRTLLGQLTQLGIGIGANSMLLSFSRADESQADYNGAAMMSEAGYNPLEMAHFFEKLEAAGANSRVAQFLSDHPNPGNRVRAVEAEVQQMPRRTYSANTGQFVRIKDLVSHLAAPGQLRGSYDDGHAPAPPPARPSGRFQQYRGQSFAFGYPENWQVFGDQQGNMVTIAPREGLVQQANGGFGVGYGLEVSYYFPQADSIDLNRETGALISQLVRQNPGMREIDRRGVMVGGERGLLTTLNSRSPFAGEQEADMLLTVVRPEGLFYMIFIAPKSELNDVRGTFDQIIRSLQFS